MQYDIIKADLNHIFQDIFNDINIKIYEEMTARDIDDWDSLTHINIIVAAEKKFRISFTTREVGALRNVGDFIKLIYSKTSPS